MNEIVNEIKADIKKNQITAKIEIEQFNSRIVLKIYEKIRKEETFNSLLFKWAKQYHIRFTIKYPSKMGIFHKKISEELLQKG